MQDSKHIHNSEDELLKQEKDIYPVKKSSSFDQSKLMRTPEAEPREFVYVYAYRENKTRRMKKREFLEKLGDQNYDQAKIPYSIGSIPICTDNDGLGGGETIVARVHVNTALRLQRWLGVQKRLYIVDAIKL
ncbi:hypothetical protein E4T52_08506 [Aureobasidium sp. EXF-3400]|nr:hypothetical protein E4T51_04055 [Aureobasidium sp. EXF-12344]KAI4776550.1 hypothetical protein E4T52_08506 [Aureobasidium sp. EXF-3400]